MRTASAILALLLLLSGCASSPRREALAEELYNLGNAYLEAGDLERAVDFFSRAVETDPMLLDAHHNLSLALIRRGNPGRALAVLEPLLEQDPDNLGLLALRGYAYYVLGELEQAQDELTRVAELSPGNRDALYNLGIVLWTRERRSQAVEVFEQLLSHSERDEVALDALYNLAIIHLEQPDGSLVSEQYYDEITGTPAGRGDPEAQATAEEAPEQESSETETEPEAADTTDPAEEEPEDSEGPGAPQTQEASGGPETVGEQWEADPVLAASYLRRYLEWRPEEVAVRMLLAATLRVEGRLLEALEVLSGVIEIEPGNAGAWLQRAEILLTSVEDPEAGLLALRRALQNGFEDRQRAQELLADPDLLDRVDVEAILREFGLLAPR